MITLLDAGFFDVLNGDDEKKFLSPETQSQLKKKAKEVVSREEVEEKGNDPDTADTIADRVVDDNVSREQANDEIAAEQRGEEVLANTNIQAAEGTRKIW